jgi:hypothetical protein
MNELELVDSNLNAKAEPRKLRDSTYKIAQREGHYDENEEAEKGGEIGFDSNIDASRKL